MLSLGILLGESVRVGVAGDIEPVTTPALPVSRRREKSLEEFAVGGVFIERGPGKEVIHRRG